MTVTEAIKKRWSPRAFSDQKTDQKTIRDLLEAAASAPSCFNEQPWRYLVGFKGDETYEKIYNSMSDFNKSWTKTAPVLMIGCVQNKFKQGGKDNPHASHDLGAATAYLTMHAMEENIFVHQMAGFSPEAIEQSFDLPEDATALTAIALGYLGDKNDLPEELAAIERPESPRNPIEEFAFKGKWEQPIS